MFVRRLQYPSVPAVQALFQKSLVVLAVVGTVSLCITTLATFLIQIVSQSTLQ